MIELKNEKVAVPVVLFAGLIWSFGPLVVRYMNDPHLVPWQYIFGRGLTIFIVLNLYLFFEEGKNFYKNWLFGCSGWNRSRNCNDLFYIFNYQHECGCNFIVFSSNAFFYCSIRFFIFKRENFS